LKLLIDECLMAIVAELLVAGGLDAVHVADRGLLAHPDEDVAACALAEGRVVVSADTDFGELLAKSGAGRPSFLLLRRTGHRPEDQVAILLVNLSIIADDLEAGAVVVISDDRIRVRRLPIRPR
jgi:predicted nuclease of predicted toxin-antitoxin system